MFTARSERKIKIKNKRYSICNSQSLPVCCCVKTTYSWLTFCSIRISNLSGQHIRLEKKRYRRGRQRKRERIVNNPLHVTTAGNVILRRSRCVAAIVLQAVNWETESFLCVDFESGRARSVISCPKKNGTCFDVPRKRPGTGVYIIITGWRQDGATPRRSELGGSQGTLI